MFKGKQSRPGFQIFFHKPNTVSKETGFLIVSHKRQWAIPPSCLNLKTRFQRKVIIGTLWFLLWCTKRQGYIWECDQSDSHTMQPPGFSPDLWHLMGFQVDFTNESSELTAARLQDSICSLWEKYKRLGNQELFTHTQCSTLKSCPRRYEPQNLKARPESGPIPSKHGSCASFPHFFILPQFKFNEKRSRIGWPNNARARRNIFYRSCPLAFHLWRPCSAAAFQRKRGSSLGRSISRTT